MTVETVNPRDDRLHEPLLPAAPEGVTWTQCSLTIDDPNLSFETYEELLRAAGAVKNASSFWIGDLVIFGDRRYGERYSQAIDATGLRYGTIANYAHVCSRVAPSRRIPTLSFAHHEAVAKLEPADQSEWLQKAAGNGWSRDELRDAMRDAGRLQQPPAADPTPTPTKVPAPRETLTSVDIVETSRGLSEVEDVLRAAHRAVEGETVQIDPREITNALRVVDESQATITAAAARLARPSLLEASQRVVKQATRSSGFAMVPLDVFEAFQEAVAQEERS